ncbi:hypothetical protein EIP91_009339 [Steccherinum ochraceum]|uniref:Uncharacterized protein n=1 Tax=Steccherinum ochraceum TaxID=92696 RepID=A0A4R0RTM0_9APHY|nr:hypothetical protein EIP91_009339 [Steccherinum ochraceum]
MSSESPLNQQSDNKNLERPMDNPNALVPAAIAPPEILAAIFRLYVDYALSTLSSGRWPFSPFKWIVGITHTCRYWREVALGTPTLWTHIAVDVCTVDVIKAFVERSGTAPLTVEAGFQEDEIPVDRLRALQPAIRRVQKLQLQLPRAQYRDLVGSGPVGAITSLTSLTLYAPSFGEPELSLPIIDFFPHTFPSLRHLDARGYAINWDPSLFPKTLNSLHIEGPGSAPASDVMAVLATLPALQDLSLAYTMDEAALTTKVALPSLTDLTLHGSHILPTLLVLNHLELSSHSNLEIVAIRSGDAEPDAVLPIVKALELLMSSGESVSRVGIDLSNGGLSFYGSPENSQVIRSLKLHCSPREERTTGLDALNALITLFPMPNVTELDITLADPPLHPSHVTPLFKTLTGMKNIHTLSANSPRGSPQYNYSDGCLTCILGSRLREDNSFVLPNLRRLALVPIVVDPRTGEREIIRYKYFDTMAIEDLQEVLEFRRQAGFGVKELALDRTLSFMFEKDIERFREKCVDDVQFY